MLTGNIYVDLISIVILLGGAVLISLFFNLPYSTQSQIWSRGIHFPGVFKINTRYLKAISRFFEATIPVAIVVSIFLSLTKGDSYIVLIEIIWMVVLLLYIIYNFLLIPAIYNVEKHEAVLQGVNQCTVLIERTLDSCLKQDMPNHSPADTKTYKQQKEVLLSNIIASLKEKSHESFSPTQANNIEIKLNKPIRDEIASLIENQP